jgi:hypothetical protein
MEGLGKLIKKKLILFMALIELRNSYVKREKIFFFFFFK